MEGPDTGLHGSYPVPALDNSVYIGPRRKQSHSKSIRLSRKKSSVLRLREGKRKADREMYL